MLQRPQRPAHAGETSRLPNKARAQGGPHDLTQPTRRSRKTGAAIARTREAPSSPISTSAATQGWKAVEAEGRLSEAGWRKEQQWALDMGLPALKA